MQMPTSKLWQSDGNTTKGRPGIRNNGTSAASTNGTINCSISASLCYKPLGSSMSNRDEKSACQPGLCDEDFGGGDHGDYQVYSRLQSIVINFTRCNVLLSHIITSITIFHNHTLHRSRCTESIAHDLSLSSNEDCLASIQWRYGQKQYQDIHAAFLISFGDTQLRPNIFVCLFEHVGCWVMEDAPKLIASRMCSPGFRIGELSNRR